MLNMTDDFREAVVGVSRRMLARAVVEIVDPDIQYGESAGSGGAAWSHPEQLRDREIDSGPRYATLEPGRWILDGSVELFPDDYATEGQMGHVGNVVSDSDGSFPGTVYAEQPFSNVSILQACTVCFPTDPLDGVPSDFRVVVLSDGQEAYSKSFTGNLATSVTLQDFTVYDPDTIRVYVTRWSLPYRRMRVLDIIPGLSEQWERSEIVSLDVQMRGNFADLALPYGTADLRIRNRDRRFEPYTRSGIFQSIEERQSIPLFLGTELATGMTEYAPVGVFFQKSGGWTTGQNDMYIDWSLVDICGLLADRTFQIPDTLPTTLAGWFACFVGQLGDNFAGWYHVDPDYADLAVTVNDREHLKNRTCGALIRFACMATGTWPRADQETGYLTAEPLWNAGSKVTVNQLTDYPVKSANDELATLTFKIYDGTEDGTTYEVSGNSTSSSKNLSIDNPFIHTSTAALSAAKQILSQYGGIKLEADSRGDPATEIGDVDTIWISKSEAKSARRMEQSFKYSGGVLKQNRNIWLQADGSYLYSRSVVLTESGTWTAPAGVTTLRIALGQGGTGGGYGEDGYVSGSGNLPGSGVAAGEGEPGQDGTGGKVWFGVIKINSGQTYTATIGKGGAAATKKGAAGAEGGETTFGVYSSANGQRYPNGYTDINSGASYARTGVAVPVDGTSDGGAGGKGGEAGQGYWEQLFWTQNDVDSGKHPGTASDGSSIVGKPRGWNFVVTKKPGKGQPGKAGAGGFVLISWDIEEET